MKNKQKEQMLQEKLKKNLLKVIKKLRKQLLKITLIQQEEISLQEILHKNHQHLLVEMEAEE